MKLTRRLSGKKLNEESAIEIQKRGYQLRAGRKRISLILIHAAGKAPAS